MDDEELSPPVGASVWERQMFDYINEHVRQEGKLLDEYVQTAGATESKALTYLLGLLIEDEHRHHRIFKELALSLKSEAELSGVEPVVPRLDLYRIERDDLLEVTGRLLEHEEADSRDLKGLHNELRDLQHTTLWGLLVEMMMMDTEKHIAILRFVERHAKQKRSVLRRNF